MKKLIAVLALVLVAAPAFAVSIVNSKHDLAVTDELCAYCHTPHAAANIASAPLWNRGNITAGYNWYTRSTLNAGTQAVTNTDIGLCISCHDGTTAYNSGIVNQPNALSLTNTGTMGTVVAAIGTNLTNDHPVGFQYNDATAADGLFNTKPAWASLGNNTQMQCASCHDVHNNAFAPFLQTNNANSALCLGCHNK